MTSNSRKLQNVQSLSDEARRDYFVRKVADFEVVWGLSDRGWATAETGGVVAVPFWPEEEFTALCAIDEWSGFSPRPIPLDDFLSKWLPGMQEDDRVCLIFPTPHSRGLVLPPDQLKMLIEGELQQYE